MLNIKNIFKLIIFNYYKITFVIYITIMKILIKYIIKKHYIQNYFKSKKNTWKN